MTFKIIKETSPLTSLRRRFPQYKITKIDEEIFFYKSMFSLKSFARMYPLHKRIFTYSENKDAIFVAKELDYELIVKE